MEYSPSSSTSPIIIEKCQVCGFEGHGYHFGAFTCRACAAFFRRCHLAATTEHRKCRNKYSTCVPNRNGKWFCKKCRFDRCNKLGMSSANIQYDRDIFKIAIQPGSLAESEVKMKIRKDRVQSPAMNDTRPEDALLIQIVHTIDEEETLPYIDTSELVEKAISTILTPNVVHSSKRMSDLEKLTKGFVEFQTSQKQEMSEISSLSSTDYMKDFERSMCGSANWLACSDRIQSFDDELKVELLKSVWWIWGRLERMSMTAKMRAEGSCGKKQFLFSPDGFVDYDRMSPEMSCWSKRKFEEMKFFFVPREIFYDDVIWSIIETDPDDMELTFIVCCICFQVAGKHFGGQIQEKLEKFQDVLSNDLHEYYMKNNKRMYLLRLKKLMKIQEQFLKLRNSRLEKYEVAGVFKMFGASFSHPEFFCFTP
ncbi:hypothetical protein GCK72_018980 [Caenorhabditis remanei]|uniref:Uncharacterized protein n=1 Tax=Caenorhabditis remanei TaxID=31234 RepID=A0A6A5GCR5_CAERE|nr:hypothetical protein GCK72_018980 [Caenorhabditis remanei]KAF1752425.1 hypothetical protein GCK72_018980 [Caenorhabditis remanei]